MHTRLCMPTFAIRPRVNRALANVHPMQATVEQHLLALGMEGVAYASATGALVSVVYASATAIRAPTCVSWNLSNSAKDVVRRLAHLEEAQRGRTRSVYRPE